MLHPEPVLVPGDAVECGGRIVSYEGLVFVDPLPLGPPEVEYGWEPPPISFLAIECSLESPALAQLVGTGAFYHCRGRWGGRFFHISDAIQFSDEETRKRRSEHFYGEPEWLTCTLTQEESEAINSSIPAELDNQVLGVGAPSDPPFSGRWGLLIWIHHMTAEWSRFAADLPGSSCAVVPVLSVVTSQAA